MREGNLPRCQRFNDKKNRCPGVAGRRFYAKDGDAPIGNWYGEKAGSGLDQFLAGTNQGAKSFCQQAGVERLFERFIDSGSIE